MPKPSAHLLARACEPRGIVQLLCPFVAHAGAVCVALEDATRRNTLVFLCLHEGPFRPEARGDVGAAGTSKTAGPF